MTNTFVRTHGGFNKVELIQMNLASFCVFGFLLSFGVSCVMSSDTPPATKSYKLGQREIAMQLPRGMQLRGHSAKKEANYPVYMQWGRKPWSPGGGMEERYANVVVLSYFDNSEYGRLTRNDGSMYASPYYLDTVRELHLAIKIYKTTQGRAPIVIRYDVKDEHGVFCLVASVETYENTDPEADVQEMIASLKSFSPKKK